jgi:mono/diheme cytochrome c family protein
MKFQVGRELDMRSLIAGLCAAGAIAIGTSWQCLAADQPTPSTSQPGLSQTAPASGAAPAAGPSGEAATGACCQAGDSTPPVDLEKKTPKGQLKNPYNDKVDQLADEGHQKYMGAGCNGCHGGGGGGGMCPPVTNDVWVYGADDDTLFRLVTLGSDGLQKEGYHRKGSENIVGPMPPFGGILKTSDDLWKIIAWVRTVNPNSKALESKPAQ